MNSIFDTIAQINEIAVALLELVKTNNVTITLTLVFAKSTGEKVSIIHENLRITVTHENLEKSETTITNSLEVVKILSIFKLYQNNELNQKLDNPYFSYAERGERSTKERSLFVMNTKYFITNVDISAAAISWNGSYLKHMRYIFDFKVFQANNKVAYYFDGIDVVSQHILNEKKFKKIVEQLIENGFCKEKIDSIIGNKK